MYKKTFLSLSFTGGKLHLLQLSLNKKQVLHFGVVDIPQGVIQSYKVTDTAKLAQVIKSAYKQFQFNEKGAGLVVPEFSTYTRTLDMPKLTPEELDEAVRWKMRDYLPDSGAKMVMDWKIINTLADGYQVLVVSILEEVLQSYVAAIVAAGLMPLVVETPSLSLSRVSKSDSVPKLILYGDGGEALLLALRGEEILGSVVAKSTDQNLLIKQASQMGRHFLQTPMQKLLIGGLDITQTTLKNLSLVLKVPVEWFNISIKGLTPPQVQEFLTPISLQMVDPSEPADTHTINLLPVNWAKLYQDRHIKNQLWSLTLFASIIIWVCLIATLAANLFISRLEASYKAESKQHGETPSELVSKVNTINQNADYIVKITQSKLDPGAIINSITSIKPAGISVASYEVNLEQGVIVVTGNSADRVSLVEFKDALEQNKDFGKIDIPITALAQESNISFTLNFDYIPAQSTKPANKTAPRLKLQ